MSDRINRIMDYAEIAKQIDDSDSLCQRLIDDLNSVHEHICIAARSKRNNDADTLCEGDYRFLIRSKQATLPLNIAFIGMNPSTATRVARNSAEEHGDRTTEFCLKLLGLMDFDVSANMDEVVQRCAALIQEKQHRGDGPTGSVAFANIYPGICSKSSKVSELIEDNGDTIADSSPLLFNDIVLRAVTEWADLIFVMYGNTNGKKNSWKKELCKRMAETCAGSAEDHNIMVCMRNKNRDPMHIGPLTRRFIREREFDEFFIEEMKKKFLK